MKTVFITIAVLVGISIISSLFTLLSIEIQLIEHNQTQKQLLEVEKQRLKQDSIRTRVECDYKNYLMKTGK